MQNYSRHFRKRIGSRGRRSTCGKQNNSKAHFYTLIYYTEILLHAHIIMFLCVWEYIWYYVRLPFLRESS